MLESFLADRVQLHCGDCLDVLARLDGNSIDSCVTDPPYHLTSIVKRFGADSAAPANFGIDGVYARASAGFMGKKWDGGDIAFRPEVWAAVYRVLKPGAHLLAMGGTRTYHRLVCAIEDAGFEIRDTISWLYGSGFPKSHDVSKGVDRTLDFERIIVNVNTKARSTTHNSALPTVGGTTVYKTWNVTAPGNLFSNAWDGWGTGLKPACELIVLARKPLSEATVAANVLKWGTGALNIDGCRVPTEPRSAHGDGNRRGQPGQIFKRLPVCNYPAASFRWPANVIHDGSDEVVAAFPECGPASDKPRNNGAFDSVAKGHDYPHVTFGHDDPGGSAARFFYTAKADSDDRIGSKHPTVKPLDLMQYLVRLITPKGGTVLDPFAGTGTNGEAAWREGMRAVLIEREAEYQVDIRRRMALALAGPDERTRESIKAKNLPRDDGPLFQWQASANEYDAIDDFSRSIEDCYAAVRERKAQGGKGWPE